MYLMNATTIAANDTAAPATIALGTTEEGAAWRAHRYATHVELTSLANAGKRGRTCLVLRVRGNAEQIEMVCPFILSALDVPEATMAAALDVGELGMTVEKGEARGVDVPREPTITVRSDLVDGTFTTREATIRFTAIHGRPGGGTFRHDTIVGACGAKDAAKAYAWVKANRERLVTMTLPEFRMEIGAVGARFS